MAEAKGSNHTKRATYDLRQKIIQGEYAGGTRLLEVALAEQMGISRTPVREAMSRLAEEGLLERARGGGFVVRSFSYSDVVDAIEIRGVLEGTAARLAAERGAPEGKLRQIKAVVAQIDTCFEPSGQLRAFDAYSELNSEFHDLMAALCGSAIVQRELERVKSLPFASPAAFVLGGHRDDPSDRSLLMAQAQHRAIVSAIENREGARAEALAREHARFARGSLEATFIKGATEAEGLPGMALIVR